jgi:hypothetical protein
MTLGRTSENKIKIKTDGEAGLRAVSCGCCGNCLFDAFSPTPTPIEGAPKFKYLTYEFTMPLYDFSGFNSGLNSWRLDCAPYTTEGGGTAYTCMPLSNAQREERQSIQYKFTQFLKSETNTSGVRFCSCHIVKAHGSHELRQDNWAGNNECSVGVCWRPNDHLSFTAVIQDANWTTWADENGKLFLDQKTADAKWVSSCESYYWEPIGETFRPWYYDSPLCPDGIGCANSGPASGWQFYSAIDGGGFKTRERTHKNILVTYEAGENSISHEITFTIRQTLHNTLAEIWGPDQPEMRP